MSLTTSVYRDGVRASQELPFERVTGVLAEEGSLVWVDVAQPSAEEVVRLQAQFGLHPLAVEDALHAHQRPKIDQYGDIFFLVAYAAVLEGDEIELHEFGMFVGPGFLITVRHHPDHSLERTRERLERVPQLVRTGVGFIAYSVLDDAVDGYFPILEEYAERIEQLEEELLAGQGDGETLPRAFVLKRQMLLFRRVVAPLREVLGAVVRRDHAVLGHELDDYARDLHDHVVRVYEELDAYRELLTGALDAHLSVVSNRLNEVVLQLTSWGAIVLVPSLIAAVYGMNFHDMPELSWRFGYPYALALMGGSAAGLYALFKRRSWL